MAKSVAQKFIELLVKAGIKFIYAVTGDSLNEFNNAVRRTTASEIFSQGRKNPGHLHLINGLH